MVCELSSFEWWSQIQITLGDVTQKIPGADILSDNHIRLARLPRLVFVFITFLSKEMGINANYSMFMAIEPQQDNDWDILHTDLPSIIEEFLDRVHAGIVKNHRTT